MSTAFKIIAETEAGGRRGQLCLPHQTVDTPVFMPVGTAGTVKAVAQDVLESLGAAHRVLLVEENKPFCGVGAQLAYLIQEQAFDDLDAPVKRLSALDAPAIYSQPLEKEQLPNPQRIMEAVLRML